MSLLAASSWRTSVDPRGSPKNTHILDGEAEDLYKECEEYETAIRDAGGIDLFLGGIGADGHIAFNEVSRLVTAVIAAFAGLSLSLTLARFIPFISDQDQDPRI